MYLWHSSTCATIAQCFNMYRDPSIVTAAKFQVEDEYLNSLIQCHLFICLISETTRESLLLRLIT